jgi:nitroreductase/FMN reductase (NADPH)/FMN reductase [NAD(P)H]
MLVFGYPTQQQKDRPKPLRCDYGSMVHENTYHPMDSAELKKLFKNQHGDKPYEEWFRAFCTRKYNSDFAKEMSRSVEIYLDDFPFKME